MIARLLGRRWAVLLVRRDGTRIRLLHRYRDERKALAVAEVVRFAVRDGYSIQVRGVWPWSRR